MPKHAPKVNLYAIVSRAVEEGVASGLARAKKHTDTPTDEHVCTEIERYVMLALCEVLKL